MPSNYYYMNEYELTVADIMWLPEERKTTLIIAEQGAIFDSDRRCLAFRIEFEDGQVGNYHLVHGNTHDKAAEAIGNIAVRFLALATRHPAGKLFAFASSQEHTRYESLMHDHVWSHIHLPRHYQYINSDTKKVKMKSVLTVASHVHLIQIDG